MKTISFELSASSIEKAIREVNAYKDSIVRKTETLTDKIADTIADEAQSGFNNALLDDLIDGEHESPDVSVTKSVHGTSGTVDANGTDAVWVEFGAGVYHNGAAGSSPHPAGAELGMTIGGYGYGYGKRKVWGFPKDDGIALTHGTPAAMPMSKAANDARNNLADIAREVFDSD